MLTPAQEVALIELIRQVAHDEIRPRFRKLPHHAIRSKSAFDDLVTEADVAAEQALTRGVLALLPEARVIGEEAVAADPQVIEQLAGAGLAVIIDPIDGTWNYANGLATHGVLLAVVEDEETRFGILYDPVVDDWILARKGGGAWFCAPGEAPLRLSVSAGKPFDRLVGFVSPFNFRQQQRPGIARGMLEFGRAHGLRCACHEYRTLIQGKVDFYINASAKPWDHAAGVLAVQEAGGCAGMLDGRDYSPLLTSGCVIAAHSAQTLEAIRARLNHHLG